MSANASDEWLDFFYGSARGANGKTLASEALGNSAASGITGADDKANFVSHGHTS